MCGIFGAIGRDLSQRDLENVLATLHHRGPDGRGSFTDREAKITLGHTRLAIIDLETGAQPLASSDGNIVLVANGEIYDFERIRTSLRRKGHEFATKSDSEVVIGLYQEYGLAFFQHLRGEFAFLLYDKAKRLLIAARDRFGIKPLYFTRLPGGYVFASEMKAIFASGLAAAKLDVSAFDLLLNQDPENAQFPFVGIEHVPPGSYLAIDIGTPETKMVRYWSPEIPATMADPVSADDDACAALASSVRDTLEDAVRLRLRADVPVGLYLSGGLDSCFVGALMTRNLPCQLHSFSISFSGSDRNEQEFTREAATFLGTAHHELQLTKGMLWSNLEECLWSTELPFVSLAPVGKFLLSNEARKSVTVVLNGQGADEVFLGYRRFFEEAIRDSRRLHAPAAASARLRRLKVTANWEPIVKWLSLLLFNKEHRSSLASARRAMRIGRPANKPTINAVQEARIADMPFDILGYLGDSVEMAHSLEVRVPFLDHKLYELAKFIPADVKMRDGVEKAILRDGAKGLLPERLRLRRKLGFMLTSEPVDFFGADCELTVALRARYLSPQAFSRSGIFSYRTYKALRCLAKIPGTRRVHMLKGIRRTANKAILYMMQTHMLHRLFVEEPLWQRDSGVSGPRAITRSLTDEFHEPLPA